MNNLKHFRHLRGMTQQELSDLSGVARDSISKLENNHRQMSTKTALTLSKCLKCKIGELIKEEPDEL